MKCKSYELGGVWDTILPLSNARLLKIKTWPLGTKVWQTSKVAIEGSFSKTQSNSRRLCSDIWQINNWNPVLWFRITAVILKREGDFAPGRASQERACAHTCTLRDVGGVGGEPVVRIERDHLCPFTESLSLPHHHSAYRRHSQK